MKYLTGNRYGKLYVIGLERKEQRLIKGRKQGFIYYYRCKCDCGNYKSIAMNHLKAGKTISCGCVRDNPSTEKLMEWVINYRVSLGKQPDESLTELNKLQRAYFAPFSKQVMELDGYCCIWCNSGTRLSVHHIDKWSDNEERRFDKTNLVTLCTDCHYIVHNYGRYHSQPNPIMSILLEGYAKEMEAICMRVELT